MQFYKVLRKKSWNKKKGSPSAPPSVHGSRVDLSSFDKGSAIYLGCSPPRQNSFSASTSPAIPNQSNTGAISKTASNNRGSNLSISGRATKSPKNTPPASPKKQSNQMKSRLKSTNNNANATNSNSNSNLSTLSATDNKINSKNSKNTANTMTAAATTPATPR